MIMSDHFKILPAPIAAGLEGVAVEPEEAPTQRVQELPLTMSLGSGPHDPGTPFKQGITPVKTDFLAGEVAKGVSSRCAQCVHFRNDLWRTTMKNWERSNIGRRRTLNRFIVSLARATTEKNPTLEEIDDAAKQLEFFGVCGALTEAKNDLSVVHPDGGCPEGFAGYQPRDRVARREASKNFDRIMRSAQGKI